MHLRAALCIVCVATLLGESARALGASSLPDVLKGDDPMTTQVKAGQLTLTLEKSADGIAVRRLTDSATGSGFFTAEPLPLFTLMLRRARCNRECGARPMSMNACIPIRG